MGGVCCSNVYGLWLRFSDVPDVGSGGGGLEGGVATIRLRNREFPFD